MAHQTANRLRGGKKLGKNRDREGDSQTDRQAGRQTDKQTDRQAGRQAGRHTDRYIWHMYFFGVCLLYIVSCHNYMYYVCET